MRQQCTIFFPLVNCVRVSSDKLVINTKHYELQHELGGYYTTPSGGTCLVPRLCASPGKKQSGEQRQVSWTYYQIW